MNAAKMDKRVRYTKAMLRQALLKLMEQRPIGKITVTDVCAAADINRNTFYAHYASVEKLLRSIENEIFQEIRQALESQQGEDSLLDICRTMHENKDLFRILFSANSDEKFLKRMMQLIQGTTLQRWRQEVEAFPAFSEYQLTLLYTYSISGSFAVLRKWLLEDLPLAPEEIAQLLRSVNHTGPLHAAQAQATPG